MGSGIAKAGVQALVWSGLLKIAVFIVVAPFLGAFLGYVLMVAVYWICRRGHPRRIDRWFRRLQLISAGAYSLGHDTNDAKKTMGIITVHTITGAIIDVGATTKLSAVRWGVAANDIH